MDKIFEETDPKKVEQLLNFWKTIREDIGKFDHIITSNFIQHMIILVSLLTLTAYLYLGNPDLEVLCCIIDIIVVVLALAFRIQNKLYQRLIGNCIQFGTHIENQIFKEEYKLSEALDKNLPIKSQNRAYSYSYTLIIGVAVVMAILFASINLGILTL